MIVNPDYSSALRAGRSVQPYNQDYIGSIKLLENSGFSPFEEKSPINSTLNQIFSQFTEKNNLDTSSTELRSEFYEKNPSVRRALFTYDALEKAFSPKSAGKTSPIIDFLNDKLESSKQNDVQPQAAAGAETQSTPRSVSGIDFARDFAPLRNISEYFGTAIGTLVDTYA